MCTRDVVRSTAALPSPVTNPMSAFQKMIQYVSQMRNASLGLEQDFAECKTPGFNGQMCASAWHNFAAFLLVSDSILHT